MWRQVALDTPQLWNDITLIEPRDSAALRIAQRLLSRAGGLPISLTIDWSTSGVDVNKGFEELMNHHLFESLDINLQSQHLPQLSQLPQNLASNVKKLNAIVYSDNAHSNDTHLSLPSEHFPQLESFRMHAVVIAHLVLPWTQHRHLDLASTMLPWELCLGILPQCTSVEECFLSLYGRSPHLVSDISLPLLQRLSLTSVRGAASFCNIMQPLITPQLTTLGLRGVALGCSNYNSVVQRNNLGQLQVLRLASVSDSSNIHRFLCNTPSLHTIQLPYLRGDFDPKALERLSDGQLAPLLQTVEINSSTNNDVAGEILTMVEVRVKTTGSKTQDGEKTYPMKRIKLSKASSLQPHIRKRLDALETYGVDVYIMTIH
ncbi:hypothetical protein AMATHDRAFT_48737 [Amanita thiersii Skay4041]|uniref:F-box domain-containing protein n=1 Tax=Amanita thiersii Skay4041 TaxID=703135 RepID=A0A2A9NH77_9AGAR|nr:hypothetical protein AMATHDRAFT_48737 [Amanita thiersii Skay4041]